MVKICPLAYTGNMTSEEFAAFGYTYELHDFQKWAIEGILSGKHVLLCAPTGSGKTVPGEFAFQHYARAAGGALATEGRKKTIYTTPMKALSNEKFAAFTAKYPDISFGLVTGDIKVNTNADVLIMTTEILTNKLLQPAGSGSSSTKGDLDVDVQTEVGCVVFDEIHFINDPDRGHVWEKCLMHLPEHVQIIGLSATLQGPERFAEWLEHRSAGATAATSSGREVWLTQRQDRAVPLHHYAFVTVAEGAVGKHIKDKTILAELNAVKNRLVPLLRAPSGGAQAPQLDEIALKRVEKFLGTVAKAAVKPTAAFVLNQAAAYITEHEMTPALCFVFSRKRLEQYASQITVPLLEFDSKVPYMIDRECEQIVRRLPNFEDYMRLPEYTALVGLLRKGVATHHAGMIPILREMVEILFARGYIKLLFCTETISVGVNLPVKTTLFTDVCKYASSAGVGGGMVNRFLQSHEYIQSAGRAGRLGLDTVGHVIHLTNLFSCYGGGGGGSSHIEEIRRMMFGMSQTLLSKFRIDAEVVLAMCAASAASDTTTPITIEELEKGMQNTMKYADIVNCCRGDAEKLAAAEQNYAAEHAELTEEMNMLDADDQQMVSKMIAEKQDMEKLRRSLEGCTITRKSKHNSRVRKSSTAKDLDKIALKALNLQSKKTELEQHRREYESTRYFMEQSLQIRIRYLQTKGFLAVTAATKTNAISITTSGILATKFHEIPGTLMAWVVMSEEFQTYSAREIAMLLALFIDFRMRDTDSSMASDAIVPAHVLKFAQSAMEAMCCPGVVNNRSDELSVEFAAMVGEWCACETEESCKIVIQTSSVFLGDFVKSMLKIVNSCREVEMAAEYIGNIKLLHTVSQVPGLVMKHVVTNKSLYV